MSFDLSIQAKEEFYSKIDSLDAPLDGENDNISEDVDLRKNSRAFFTQGQPTKWNHGNTENITRSAADDRQTTALEISRSSPVETGDNGSNIVKATPSAFGRRRAEYSQIHPANTSFVEETPPQDRAPPSSSKSRRSLANPASLHSLSTHFPEKSPSVMSATNSRKGSAKGKGKSKDTVPESEQILKGMIFFYIPQYRISIRKGRMELAERFGAVVSNDLLNSTHIIVDDNLKYDDIKSIIAPVLGKNKPVIAGEHWPIFCIQERRILPVSAKYQVRGMPLGKEAAALGQRGEQTAAQVFDKSLTLKPHHQNSNRWDYVPEQTPSQSDASPTKCLDKRKVDAISDEQPPTRDIGKEGITIPSSDPLPEEDTRTSERQNFLKTPYQVGSAFGDELSKLIDVVREEYKDIPRIGEEDANLHPEGIEDDDTDDEHDTKKRKKSGGEKVEKKSNLEDYFACNRGGTKDQASNQDNPNARTIAVFQKMLEYYEQTNDHWRIRAYRNAISTLSKTMVLVTTAEEAEQLPWFGKKLAAKLEEIVGTNTLKRLEYAQNDPTSKILALFLGIYGVGKSTADKWIAQGFRTLDDLLERAELTYSQRVGIEHYDDLNSRIPRTEVTKLGELVKEEASMIDRDVELIIAGSYRRGAESSGDIDFIITKKGTTSGSSLVPFLEKLVGNLTKKEFLTAELASHNFGRDNNGSKWHGCCVLPQVPGFNDNDNYRPVWRRIDLLLVPETEYGAALIYFTGNDIFNRSIRLLASRKRMRLNQRGLYRDVLRDANRRKVSEGELIEGQDEKRIFQLLNVKWREPEERWC